MEIQKYNQLLRSQLLEMLRLSQRAVDYSIKAFELGSTEFCLHVCNNGQVVDELRRAIEDRCRKSLVMGLPVDSDPRLVWSTLRICSALHAIYAAATEIARNTLLFLESGHLPESLALNELGQFANRSVRLCTVALFKEEVQHAKTIPHAHRDVAPRINAQSTLELAIAKSLVQIARQTHDIADAITVWIESKGCVTGEEWDQIELSRTRSFFYAGKSR